MFLGQFLDSKESLQDEYKEFCIKLNIFNYFTLDELNDIIENKILYKQQFNNMILDNIKLYFDIYIPKYSSAFTNSQIQNGNVQIGINDFGEITGIPIYGELDEKYINKLILDTKSLYINHDIDIDCKIIKLDVNYSFIENRISSFIEMIQKKNDTNRKIQYKYNQMRKTWINEVMKYSVKLSEIISNEETNLQFLDWIKNQDLCFIKNKISNTTPKDIEEISNKRELVDEPQSIIYWIAKFKDYKMNEVQSNKPNNIATLKYINSSVYLMTHLSDLRHQFASNGLSYYNIILHFKPKSKFITYKKINRCDTFKSFRFVKDTGPYCITEKV